MASDDAKLMLIGHLAQQVDDATRWGKRAMPRKGWLLWLILTVGTRRCGVLDHVQIALCDRLGIEVTVGSHVWHPDELCRILRYFPDFASALCSCP